MKNILIAPLLILSLLFLQEASAHPGRTDKYGGHAGSQPYHYHYDRGPTGNRDGSGAGYLMFIIAVGFFLYVHFLVDNRPRFMPKKPMPSPLGKSVVSYLPPHIPAGGYYLRKQYNIWGKVQRSEDSRLKLALASYKSGAGYLIKAQPREGHAYLRPQKKKIRVQPTFSFEGKTLKMLWLSSARIAD